MSLEANRRRFLALASLAFTAGAAGPLAAQGLPSGASPPRPSGGGIPIGPWGKEPGDGTQRPVTTEVGGWKIISQMRQSRAYLLGEKVTHSGSVKTGQFSYGGRGELKLEYWNGQGPGSGYRGWLKIESTGPGVTNFTPHIFVDGEEREGSTFSERDGQDLKEWFGERLEGLAEVKTIRATMHIDGQDVTVYEATLEGTADAMKAMREVPDFNYQVFDIGKQKPGAGGSGPGGPGSGGKGCYLTTACCDLVGLDDDCFELTTLRRFRDQVMARTEEGSRAITRYYDLAPRILAEMARRGEERLLLGLYFSHILPSAVLARLGFRSLPMWLYGRMTRRLIARYLPERS